jgi:hypothetical protein
MSASSSHGGDGNIAALNYCYDVPVKLYSTELLLMAIIPVAPRGLRSPSSILLRSDTAPAT